MSRRRSTRPPRNRKPQSRGADAVHASAAPPAPSDPPKTIVEMVEETVVHASDELAEVDAAWDEV
jgi:hypothetical protein